MLPKENRLKKKKDFEKIFKEGKGSKEGLLFLKLVPNGSDKVRFGITVSQKVSKKATRRNKIKRQLRAIINLKLAEIKKGIDVVLVALPGLETKDFRKIEEIVNTLFKKAKIIKNAKKNNSWSN